VTVGLHRCIMGAFPRVVSYSAVKFEGKYFTRQFFSIFSKMNTPDTTNNSFLFTSESVGEGHPGI